jgi:hypothetical protein
MPVYVVECPQQSEQMCDAGTYDQTMHNLVARTPDIEAVRIPFLGDLGDVSVFLNPHRRRVYVPSWRITHHR